MKTCYIVRTILLLILANTNQFAFSQSTSVIDTCFWTQKNDYDKDGYCSSQWLVVDFTKSTVSGYIEVWAYENNGDSVLLSPGKQNITSSWRMGYSITGTGHFTCKINVKIRYNDLVIDNFIFKDSSKFESPNYDVFTGLNFYWSTYDFMDNDDDGFYSSQVLSIQFRTMPNLSIPIYFKTYVFKDSLSPEYYFTSPIYLSGQNWDTRSVQFGSDNGELLNGNYYIKIQAFNADSNTLFCDTTLTIPIKFESKSEDGLLSENFTFSNIFLDKIIDNDKDGYSAGFDLNFGVSIDTGTYKLSAKLLRSKINDSNYYQCSKSLIFTISESNPVQQKFKYEVDNNEGRFKFKIELYLGNKLVATVSSEQYSCLLDIGNEPYNDDSPYQIKHFSLSKTVDYDGDGKPSSGEIDFTFEVMPGSDGDSVYIFCFSYYGDAGGGGTVFRTGNFYISPEDTTFSYKYDVSFIYGIKVLYLFSKSHPMGSLSETCYDKLSFSNFYRIFESQENDVNLTVKSVFYKDSTDIDGDGYFRSVVFNIDIDPFPVSTYCKLEYKIYKQSTDSIIKEICCTSRLVDSTSSDLILFWIHPHAGLEKGIYFIEAEVTLLGSGEIKIPALRISSNLKLEPASEDVVQYEITDAYFSNLFDKDNDGYYRSGNLYFKTTVDIGTHKVYGKLFYVDSSNFSYRFLASTQPFTISANDTSLTMMLIDSSIALLTHDFYDFKLELYLESNDSLLANIGPDEDSDLDNIGLELSKEDNFHFAINNTFFNDDKVDLDNDGYFQSGNLHFNTVVDYGMHSIFAKLFYKTTKDSIFIPFYSTPPYILCNTKEKTFCISIDSSLVMLPHDSYDFKIELYEADKDSIIAMYGPKDDPYLNNQKFEIFYEDIITNFIQNYYEDIKVFPNPVTTDLYIELSDYRNLKSVTISIFSSQGILIKKLTNLKAIDLIQISFDDYPSGFYLLQINSKSFSEFFGIVKK